MAKILHAAIGIPGRLAPFRTGSPSSVLASGELHLSRCFCTSPRLILARLLTLSLKRMGAATGVSQYGRMHLKILGSKFSEAL